MCALTAAGRLAGVTGALFVAEGTVRTDGVDEVEQEPSMMHPATKATGNPTRRRRGFCAFLEVGGEPARGKPIM
jgi:hypothetical protein